MNHKSRLAFRKRKTSRGVVNKNTRKALVHIVNEYANIDIFADADSYWQQYDRWKQEEGLESAISRAKLVHQCVQNYTLKQSVPDVSFLALDRDGFPRCAKKLKKWIRSGDPDCFRAVLTVTNIWRDEMVKRKSGSVESITTPGRVLEKKLVHDIAEAAPATWKFVLPNLRPPAHFFRVKSGPNGPALLTAFMDLKAMLLNERHVLWNLTSYLKCLGPGGSEFLQNLLQALKRVDIHSPTKFLVSSRVAFKNEPGGKVRPFAILDWYSQMALKPLHDHLMSILDGVQQDCTFDQDAGAEWVRKETAKGSYLSSLDLTAATDRFPVKVITHLLKTLTRDDNFGMCWENLMVKRRFDSPNGTIHWEVGQPLGNYSSWAAFALAHHCVVLLAAKRSSSPPEYVLLGDDVVLKGRDLSLEYVSIMTALGVSTNPNKSVVGFGKAEFCKRLFWFGWEISPVQAKLVRQCVKGDYLLSRELLNRLTHRAGRFRSTAWNGLPSALGYQSNTLKKASILLGFPLKADARPHPVPNDLWSFVTPIEIRMPGFLATTYRGMRLDSLLQKYQQSCNSADEVLLRLQRRQLPSSINGPLGHPVECIVRSFQERRVRLNELIGLAYQPKSTLTFEGIHFSLTNLDLDSVLPREHEVKRKAEARCVLDTYDQVKFLVERFNITGRLPEPRDWTPLGLTHLSQGPVDV